MHWEQPDFDMPKSIVTVGYVGSLGAARIAEAEREKLRTRYREDYIDKIITSGNPTVSVQLPGCEISMVAEGGILKTLYELATEKNCGMRIELKRIPFLQSTIEVCEFFAINPYRLLSDAYVAITDDSEAAIARHYKYILLLCQL